MVSNSAEQEGGLSERLSAIGEPAAMGEELAAIVDGPAAVGVWHEPSGGVGVVPSAVGEDQQRSR